MLPICNEATTNSPYPCIYRPYFSSPDGTNIIIRGYELVNGPDSLPTDPSLLTIPIDLNDSTSRSQITSNVTFVNVYGVPWIIGAKKGFANFNQASLQTVSTMTRKIQVTRPIDNGGSIRNGYHYKQMLLLSVSSRVAVGVWNSYQTNYPNATQIPIPAREVYIQADGIFSGALTNTAGPGVTAAKYNVGGPSPAPRGSITLAASTWKGTGVIPGTPGPAATTSFQVPLLADLEVVPNSMWLGGSLVPVPTNAVAQWDLVPSDSYPQANWVLTVTNNLRCMIFDGGSAGSGRLVDYVQLAGPSTLRPLSQEVQTRNFEKGLGGIWSTNIATGISGGATPQGVIDQIGISLGDPATTDTDWINNVVGYQPGSKDNEIAGFSAFFYTKQVSTNTAQVPFTPTAERSQIISWQANDPLVHYTGDDLTYAAVGQNLEVVQPPGRKVTSLETNLYRYNDRYDPWGGVPGKGSSGDPNALSMAVKDPLVRSSDDWNFPTNKLPNIGWLGRFHRGTPWQTVYLKSSQTDLKAWTNWTGNINLFVARSSMPVNDRLLFDQFTTGINDNANRGQLPINVASAYASGDPLAGLAAWSAVLSGVITLTNTGATVQPIVIDPAAVDTRNGISSPRVARIVAGINRTRANTDVKAGPVFRNGVFNHIGDVLAVPELTERSPFLNTNFISGAAANAPDEVVERIPQQILSLLTVNHTPRFVVYAYGQTLHPANNSIVTSGQFSGLCTNYQITAETATRAVVRVEGTPDPRFADTIVKGEIQHHPDEFGRTYPPHLVIESFNVLPPD